MGGLGCPTGFINIRKGLMASINKVIIVGNVGREPDVRFMPSGDSVANISVATSDRYKDKQTGEQKEHTEWHRVAFFGKLAQIAGDLLKKGSQVYIEGRLRTRKWVDAGGQEKYSTEIVAEVMQVLGGKPIATDAPASTSESTLPEVALSRPVASSYERLLAHSPS